VVSHGQLLEATEIGREPPRKLTIATDDIVVAGGDDQGEWAFHAG
jgi:hypothetical protein